MIRSLLIGQEVSIWLHLSDDWTILEELTLDVLLLDSNTVIVDLVDSVIKSALVSLEVIDVTLLLVSRVFMALGGDITLLLSPLKDLVDVSAFTAL